MRCFIAIDVPKELREWLAKLQEQLKGVPMTVKFIEKENFHLTLKFFGEISDAKVNQIKENLKEVKFKPFNVSSGKLGVFPSSGYVRVIWISLEPEEKVKELNRLINETLQSSDARFGSHITLARVRIIEDKEALQKRLREIKVEEKRFEVSNFKLKKSTVTRKGPIYEDLKVFEL